MALLLQQTDTDLQGANEAGVIMACATGTVNGVNIESLLTEGGTAGTTEQTVDIPASSSRLAIFLQSANGVPGVATWDAGDWIVRFNVTTAQMDTVLNGIWICRIDNTGSTVATIASETGIGADISGGGVFTRTLAASEHTGTDTDEIYIVVQLANNFDMTSRTVGITPDQVIDTPIEIAATVTGDGAATVPAATASGTGGREITGTGAATIAAVTSDGAGITNASGAPVTDGMVFSVDASKITGLSDGDPVATWSDLSGQGNDVSQGTAGNQPTFKTNILNSLPVVRFDSASSKFLAAADATVLDFNNQSFIFFCVFKTTEGVTSRIIEKRGQGAAGGGFPSYQLSNSSGNNWGNTLIEDINNNVAGLTAITEAYPNDGNGHIVSLEWANDTGTVGIRIDAGTADEDTNASMAGADLRTTRLFQIGGANTDAQYFTGDIAEIIVYDRALTTQERTDVEDYLSDKWLATGVSGTGAATTPAITASGSGTREITGSGTPATAPVTASGAGTREIIGSGGVTASAVTASGAGEREITGTGASTIAGTTASGSGSLTTTRILDMAGDPILDMAGEVIRDMSAEEVADVTGTGAASIAAITASGSGAREIAGTGAATIPVTTVSGVGEREITSTGAVTTPAVTATGTGQREVTGSAAPLVAAATASGAGAREITGAAALAIAPVSASATGERSITGTGAATTAAVSASGTGEREITGAGTAETPAVTTEGSGAVSGTVSGSGEVTTPSVTAAATGEREVTGTGAATVAAATAGGSGAVSGEITGTGAVDVPAVQAGATGERIVTGAANLTTTPTEAAGTGERTITASGTATTPAATAAGTGSVGDTITGTGEATVPAVTASGTGARQITGTGDATIAPVTASGLGERRITGAASVTVGSVTVTGAGTRIITGSGAVTTPAVTAAGASPAVFYSNPDRTFTARRAGAANATRSRTFIARR